MELQTAIEILEYHQEWRLGKREDMIHEPKKLTEALDIVLSEVKKFRLGAVSGHSLISEFWKESADLIEKYRDSGDERAAQGVVSCRILIDRLMKQLENNR